MPLDVLGELMLFNGSGGEWADGLEGTLKEFGRVVGFSGNVTAVGLCLMFLVNVLLQICRNKVYYY